MIDFRITRLFPRCESASQVCIHAGLDSLPSDSEVLTVLRGLSRFAISAAHISLGNAHEVIAVGAAHPPALVVRADVTNLRMNSDAGTSGPPFCRTIQNIVAQAIRHDAAGIVASLIDPQLSPALYEQTRENIRRLKSDCSDFSIPLIVQPITADSKNPDNCLHALAAEAKDIGADILRISVTDSISELGSKARLPLIAAVNAANGDFMNAAQKVIAQGAIAACLEFIKPQIPRHRDMEFRDANVRPK